MKVLVVLGDGGHTRDTLRLVELLGPKYEYSYLMPTTDRVSEAKIKFAGPVYRVSIPREKQHKPLKGLYTLFVCSVREAIVLLKVRPKAILNGGAGIGVPISFLGRLLGVKIIYLENGCRVYTLSASGKLLYRVAHLFFVQWEPLKEKYPKAIYAGRLA
jgi:beta-1,4-N-acetylglucosaminyltransferase